MAATAETTSTLATLVTRVRRRSDHENSTFVTDAEIEQYIQMSYFALYDLLIESNQDQFVDISGGVTVPGTSTYQLTDNTTGSDRPLNIYKILRVSAVLNGKTGRVRRLRSSSPIEYWDADRGWTSHDSVFYRIVTNIAIDSTVVDGYQHRSLIFYPTPQAVHSFGLVYIPTPRLLSDSPEEQFFLPYAGWDEYIVCDAAAKVLEKEESDASHLYKRLAELEARIRWHANTMDPGEADYVVADERSGYSHSWRGEPWY